MRKLWTIVAVMIAVSFIGRNLALAEDAPKKKGTEGQVGAVGDKDGECPKKKGCGKKDCPKKGDKGSIGAVGDKDGDCPKKKGGKKECPKKGDKGSIGAVGDKDGDCPKKKGGDKKECPKKKK